MAISTIDEAGLGIQAYGNRNLIINGAMQVAQRGTSITGIGGDQYASCDRFMVGVSSLGTWTSSQETDAPDGFANSYKLLCTTAKASPVTTNYVTIRQRIEAQNLQHLKWGTSNPSKLTVSFWVKSNVTGTYTLSLENEDNTNFNGRTYTIDTADTWEYKTLTYDGDSDGGINNDNGNGMELQFWLGSGSSFTSGTFTDGAWTTTSANRVSSSNVNLGSAINNYWQVTGVQLEVGDTATPFEHRSYGDELARCQRYYEQIEYPVNGAVANCHAYSTSGVHGAFYYNEKRANPSISVNNGVMCYRGTTAQTPTTLNWVYASKRSVNINPVNGMTFSVNDASYVIANASGLSIKIDAEL